MLCAAGLIDTFCVPLENNNILACEYTYVHACHDESLAGSLDGSNFAAAKLDNARRISLDQNWDNYFTHDPCPSKTAKPFAIALVTSVSWKKHRLP